MDNTANALCISHVDDIQHQTAKTPDIMLVNVTAGMGASLLINNQLVRRSGDEGWIRHITVQSSKHQPTEYFFCPRLCLNVCLSLLWQSKKIEIDQGIDFASNCKRAIDETSSGNKGFSGVFEDAGITLGRNLFIISAGRQPDFLVLAGPVFKAISYEEGVREGFEQASKNAN